MENISAKPAAVLPANEAGYPFREMVRVYGSLGAFARSHIVIVWVILIALVWYFNPIRALPFPGEVLAAFRRMLGADGAQGMVYNVYVTLKLNIVGMLIASVISLVVAYLSVIPLFQPFNKIIQWLRYIPIVGFNLVFLTLFTIGWPMKVAMLTTGMSFFLVTSMTGVIDSIPRLKYELAKVLGYNDWHVFWSVVVRPTLPAMIDMVAQNAAMGWVMITAIETYNRTEGGIGSQIYAWSSTNNLPEVYAYLIVIGVIAVLEDWIFVLIKRVLFPYSLIAERA
ncbi:MAG TPA: ABC transporter permease subunit [Blastocatellia bacterium]|nr:ABC transporter permease subunit [Blastocatellia bacterium]